MKLAYDFAFVKIKDKYVAVTSYEETGKYDKALRVNEYGMMVLKTLRKDVTREDIIEKLKSYFAGDARLEKKVDAFLSVLQKENLLID